MYEYIKNEINLFKKKHGTKFVELTQNKFFEQKTDEDLAKIMEFELKKKVEDFIKSKFNDSEISLCLEHNCEELVERQIELIQENDVIERIKNNLESQLINLLLKQKPEKVQKKPKVAYNLENLFNDDVFPSDLYSTKMKKVKKMKKELDQQTVQIDDKYQKIKPLQYENVEDKNKAQKRFIELFKTRLNNISDKKRIVSMTINVRINTGYGDIDNKKKNQY